MGEAGREGEEGHGIPQQGQCEEKEDYPPFAPAGFFKVVVQRGHAKQPPVCELEDSHLQDNGRSLQIIDNAGWEQRQRRGRQKSTSYCQRPQKQRTGISHENLGRVRIEKEKPKAASGKQGAAALQRRIAVGDAAEKEKHSAGSGHGGGQPVNAIREIDKIDAANQVQCGQRIEKDAKLYRIAGEEHPYLRPPAIQTVQCKKCNGKNSLQKQFLPRKQPFVLPFAHFGRIIHRAYCTVCQRKTQQQGKWA